MLGTERVWLVAVSLIFLFLGSARGQEVASSGLYRIVSGRYIELGGIWGSMSLPLPKEYQGFVELIVDPAGGAQMRILGEDGKTVYRIPPIGTRGEILFSFSHGIVSPGHIEFGSQFPSAPPGGLSPNFNYSVSNAANVLRINGILRNRCQFCSDVPYEFKHTNVVAVLIPEPTIRVSETEICWEAVSNFTYQVQYRTGLETEPWNDLGKPVVGEGSALCVTDKIERGQLQRYYRVVPVP